VLRRLRLATGLFLLTFVFLHLANHALGLGGLAPMNAGLELFMAVWGGPVGQSILAATALTHLSLGFYALYRRRRLSSLSTTGALQLLLGLTIPPLLLVHILGTVYAADVYGLNPDYTYLLLVFFVFDPWAGVQQGLVLLIAWTHGGLGLWYWLRLKPGFERWRDRLLGALLVIPLLALAGVAVAGREAALLAQQSAWLKARIAEINPPGKASVDAIYRLETTLLLVYAGLLLAVLVARLIHNSRFGRSDLVRLVYPGKQVVNVPLGTTVLEASQLAGIPHASVCGGRGRCSTCRVRVLHGLRSLPDASPEEQRVLRRVNAPLDVRLACQTRPQAEVEVEPLLPPGVGPLEAQRRPAPRPGEERVIAVLFADIRGFTSISETMLPYDVVFLLNRYFRAIAGALEEAGGYVDKFIGDGVMALFGLETTPEEACRQALMAARAMGTAVEDINRALAKDLERPLRIGIGIHVGTAVVGEMGHGQARALTAIGDTVNTASRLEQLTKEHGAVLVVSEAVGRLSGLSLAGAIGASTSIRGRKEPLAVLVFDGFETLSVREDEPSLGDGT